jgi:imidazolonepropionase-like amidohydrolase
MMRLLVSALLLSAASPALADSFAITGGRVVIGDGSNPIEDGTVLVVDGRVVAAGKSVAIPPGTKTIDATGKWVTPGIVAGFSRLGLVGVDAVGDSNDASADSSPFNAAIDIAPAINPDVAAIAINRAAGVTRALVSPEAGNAIFAGQGAIIDTGADSEPVTKARAFQFVEFGETGARRAGGSRAAWIATFRNALREVSMPRVNDGQLKRADADALAQVASGAQRLVIHAESANDLNAVIQLKREFPALNIVIVGATEGWRVARQLAAARIPVIASALNDLPTSFEQIAATQSNVGRMKAAGVNVAIGMIDDDDARQAQLSTQYAGNLVALTKVPGATGLNWVDAFAAITSKPAEIMGAGGEIGSLRAGRKADVVLWDGDPLEVTTAVTAVWIDGVAQPLTTRQTKLRDRYANPSEGELPKAYQR